MFTEIRAAAHCSYATIPQTSVELKDFKGAKVLSKSAIFEQMRVTTGGFSRVDFIQGEGQS